MLQSIDEGIEGVEGWVVDGCNGWPHSSGNGAAKGYAKTLP
jgi:hypothetical protein